LLSNSTIKSPYIEPQVWIARPEDLTPSLENMIRPLLSPQEKIRLSKTSHTKKIKEFLLSRALIRVALENVLKQSIHNLSFSTLSNGRLIITGLPDNCFYSLSHSSGWVVFALANHSIGADIEQTNPKRVYLDAAELFMHKNELEYFIENDYSLDFFYKTWCYKEAYFKTLTDSEQKTFISCQILAMPNDNGYFASTKIEELTLGLYSPKSIKNFKLIMANLQAPFLLKYSTTSD